MNAPLPHEPIWPEVKEIFGLADSEEDRAKRIEYVRRTSPELLTMALVLLEKEDDSVVNVDHFYCAVEAVMAADLPGSIDLVSTFVHAKTHRDARIYAGCLVHDLLRDPRTCDQGMKFFEELLQDPDEGVVDQAIDWLMTVESDAEFMAPGVPARALALLAAHRQTR